MWKDVAVVVGVASAGAYVSSKYGTKIEAQAVKMKLPPTVAHVGTIGLFSGLVFAAYKMVAK
jgi:hypothetical protein